MAIIPQSKLDLWIATKKNVMLVGRHGVGKTGIIEEAWNRAGLNFLYFSAANMDPWIDLIGVPRERSMTVDGKQVDYIECVPPKALALDEVDAIFFDEYNRAPEKVRNATMQFIQRKEVNGRKFNRLKMIWIAINPDETGEYDVQTLDPAQSDRFHVHFNIPYRPDTEYFTNKYGYIGERFVDWWFKLPEEQKQAVSPRRLDYSVQMFLDNGDVEDVLPNGVNVPELLSFIGGGSVEEQAKSMMTNKTITKEQIERFVQNDNNFRQLRPIIEAKENADMFTFFAPYIEDERVMSITADNVLLIDRFVYNSGNNPDKTELLLKNSPKNSAVETLRKGLVMRQFGIKNIEEVTKANAQEKLLSTISKALKNNDSDANMVYAAAYALQNAKTLNVGSLPIAKTLESQLKPALAKHNLESYFND